jgi:DNA-binding XRE family transcriptional regulator
MERTASLAARIKAARRKLQLTQAQAAARWRVNQRSLEAWEAGEHAPLPVFRARLEPGLKKLLLAALLFAAGPARAGETAYRVRYSLGGSGRDIIVQAESSAEARRVVMQLIPGATVTGTARAR